MVQQKNGFTIRNIGIVVSILVTIITGVVLAVTTFPTAKDVKETSDLAYFPKIEGELLKQDVGNLKVDFADALKLIREDHELLLEVKLLNEEGHKAILKEIKNLK